MQMTKNYSKIIRMTKKYSKFKPTISDKAHLELLGKFWVLSKNNSLLYATNQDFHNNCVKFIFLQTKFILRVH